MMVAVSPLGMSPETTEPDTNEVVTGVVFGVWQTFFRSGSLPRFPKFNVGHLGLGSSRPQLPRCRAENFPVRAGRLGIRFARSKSGGRGFKHQIVSNEAPWTSLLKLADATYASQKCERRPDTPPWSENTEMSATVIAPMTRGRTELRDDEFNQDVNIASPRAVTGFASIFATVPIRSAVRGPSASRLHLAVDAVHRRDECDGDETRRRHP